MARRTSLLAAAAIAGVLLGAAGTPAATLPDPVLQAVHGRVVGWARTGPGWVAVYLDRTGGGWCGLDGAAWWVALVPSPTTTDRVSSSRRIRAAMCGNSLAWVRAGRFSDGRHREVAFMLWSTPSIGATTYLYRIVGSRLVRLATFPGDRVTLGRGTVTARFENAGRSPTGTAVVRYRFVHGRYRRESA